MQAHLEEAKRDRLEGAKGLGILEGGEVVGTPLELVVGLRGEDAISLRQIGAVGERGLVISGLEVQPPHVPLLASHDDAQHAAPAPHP